jgi:hypothetical protein
MRLEDDQSNTAISDSQILTKAPEAFSLDAVSLPKYTLYHPQNICKCVNLHALVHITAVAEARQNGGRHELLTFDRHRPVCLADNAFSNFCIVDMLEPSAR